MPSVSAPSPRLVATPLLDIAVEETGPSGGIPVILLHGWPDDARTWDRLLPALHEAGYRTIVPHLRGFGGTRFRSRESLRSGQLSALGRDVLEMMDAMGIERAALVGHDWGARAAYIASCLEPGRAECCVAISVGWGTNSPDQPLSLPQAQNYWYHWLMALPRGETLVREGRLAFTRYIWSIWNPGWTVPEDEFMETAASFENPDWADVVLHSYRSRWGLAPTDPSCLDLEARLASDPVIRVPTLMLHGGVDPTNGPATSEGKEHLFAGPYRRVVLPGLGHFPQRQAPAAILAELLPFLAGAR